MLLLLPHLTPRPSPTTMPPRTCPRPRGSQSPLWGSSPVASSALLSVMLPSVSYFPIKTLRLHLHPARTLSDTAKNTEVIHKRKKEMRAKTK